MARQVVRCSGSVGANYRSACLAKSSADMILQTKDRGRRGRRIDVLARGSYRDRYGSARALEADALRGIRNLQDHDRLDQNSTPKRSIVKRKRSIVNRSFLDLEDLV